MHFKGLIHVWLNGFYKYIFNAVVILVDQGQVKFLIFENKVSRFSLQTSVLVLPRDTRKIGPYAIFFLFFFFFFFPAASGLSCSMRDLFVAARGPLSSCGVLVFSLSLWCAGSRARELSCPRACGILVPQPGIKPVSPALEGRFFTARPPGKYPLCHF